MGRHAATTSTQQEKQNDVMDTVFSQFLQNVNS